MPAAAGNQDLGRLTGTKSIIRALLIANGKLDVTIPRLNYLYREEEDENIPFGQYGYASLQEFLRSIPDVVYLRYNREHQLCVYHVDIPETAHISSLVAKQKKPTKKIAKYNVSHKPRNYNRNYHSNYSRPPPHSNSMSTLNVLQQILEELRQDPKNNRNHNGIRKIDILQKFKERSGRILISSLDELNTKLKELSQQLVLDNDFVFFKADALINSASKTLHSVERTNIYQNLEIRSAPCPNVMPKRETSQLKNNGYKPVIKQPIPQSCQVQQSSSQVNPSQTKLARQADRCQTAASIDVKQTQKPAHYESDMINERIKFRLQKLIEKYPEGIWAADIPRFYLNEYNIELNYNELGFNNITLFLSAMPEVFTITDPDKTGRHMVVDARTPFNTTENKQQTKSLAAQYNFNDYVANEKEPVPNKLSSTVSQKFIPEGMMGFDETVEHICVGSLAVEEYFEVNISEIFTPSFFWITLRKNKSKIKKLMDELAVFYKSQDLDKCRVPQVLIETGLNVACLYANMWHRAIIKKVKPDGYAIVLFYDYGTVKTYNPNHLYYLHKKFSALPAQAIACGLYNVKAPQGNEWPVISTNMFVNKIWSVPLIATVCETNENNNTMMITLTDTNDSFDLHLNEWMLENGLAVRGKMENTPSNKYHVVTYGVPLDKLCLYDEDTLRKREDDYEKSLKNKQASGATGITNGYIDSAEAQQSDMKDTELSPSYNLDSSFDPSSIAVLVRENIDLTKQTNTITQAILSNLPVNALEIPKRNAEIPTSAKTKGFENERNAVSNSSCSEEIKTTSYDLNRNLNTIKTKFSEMRNDSTADLFKSESEYENHYDRYSYRGSSAVSLSSNQSSIDYLQSTNQDSNELVNNMASNQSLYSSQSTSDLYSLSAKESNDLSKQVNDCNDDYDKLSVKDGTVTYYSVTVNDNLPKNRQISIKYPHKFEKTMLDQSTIDNNTKSDAHSIRASDDGYHTGKFTSSALPSNASSSTSFKLKSCSASFVPHELTNRCFRKIIHIFHLDDDGWVPVDEFIDSFTNLKRDRIMFKLLDTFGIKVDYKYLTRNDNLQLFSQLDRSKIKAPRESNGKIVSDCVLILMPVKAVLHVLAKLEFADPKIIKDASILIKEHKQNAANILYERYNNRILYDALNLLIQYREFRRLHTPH